MDATRTAIDSESLIEMLDLDGNENRDAGARISAVPTAIGAIYRMNFSYMTEWE